MKVFSIIVAAGLFLSACADNSTPEQRALAAQYLQQQLQQQQAQSQHFYDQQNANIRAWNAANAANRPVNCTTQYVGTTAYTSCN